MQVTDTGAPVEMVRYFDHATETETFELTSAPELSSFDPTLLVLLDPRLAEVRVAITFKGANAMADYEYDNTQDRRPVGSVAIPLRRVEYLELTGSQTCPATTS